MPACIESTVRVPITFGGRAMLTRGSLDARKNSASRLMPMPGAMTPPRYTPSPPMTSKVVAVPKSTTMHALFQRSKAATALTMRSAPTSRGLS
jgi:hypothetical protein